MSFDLESPPLRTRQQVRLSRSLHQASKYSASLQPFHISKYGCWKSVVVTESCAQRYLRRSFPRSAAFAVVSPVTKAIVYAYASTDLTSLHLRIQLRTPEHIFTQENLYLPPKPIFLGYVDTIDRQANAYTRASNRAPVVDLRISSNTWHRSFESDL